MKRTLQLSEPAAEIFAFYSSNNVTVSDSCRELFSIASTFYYYYHTKKMSTFIINPHFNAYFDRLIIHITNRLEVLFPGISKEINKDDLGYLEKLEILKDIISKKLFISIDISQKE
jgi:hypothetical protein